MVAELSKQGRLQRGGGPQAPLNSSLVGPATTTHYATLVALVAVSLATQVAAEQVLEPLVPFAREQVLEPLKEERAG